MLSQTLSPIISHPLINPTFSFQCMFFKDRSIWLWDFWGPPHLCPWWEERASCLSFLEHACFDLSISFSIFPAHFLYISVWDFCLPGDSIHKKKIICKNYFVHLRQSLKVSKSLKVAIISTSKFFIPFLRIHFPGFFNGDSSLTSQSFRFSNLYRDHAHLDHLSPV